MPAVGVVPLRQVRRRNRAVILTGAVVLAALALGTLVSTWQAVRATRANELAVTRLESEKQAHQEAEDVRHEAQDSATMAQAQRQSAVEQEKNCQGTGAAGAPALLCAAQMNLANQAWEAGNPARSSCWRGNGRNSISRTCAASSGTTFGDSAKWGADSRCVTI